MGSHRYECQHCKYRTSDRWAFADHDCKKNTDGFMPNTKQYPPTDSRLKK